MSDDFLNQPGWADLAASGGIVGDPDPAPKTAEISAMGIVNGMGEPCEDGSYVLIHIAIKDRKGFVVRLSLGGAEVLRDELKALV